MDYLKRLLSFIPDEDLAAFAIDTQANKHTKKLHGELLFKLLFYCFVTDKGNSLRDMQSALESAIFRTLSGVPDHFSLAHSSISERLNTVNPLFFEKIFRYCVEAYSGPAKEVDENIVRFDSTIVSLGTKLLNVGYNLKGGSEKHRLLKFTIGYSDIPECVCLYTEASYTSENKALLETILDNQKTDKQINVFDQGITARNSYDRLTENNIFFISRIGPGSKCTATSKNALKKMLRTETLKIKSDRWVYLYNKNKKRSKYPVRVIEAVIKESGEEIAFVTNIKDADMGTVEVTDIYKSRWDVEVFFKFIKQHLNFSHLLNRSENGIKVIMYVTMIVAILLCVYKKDNNLTGYKMVKRKFAQELENDILFNFVILCKGDPEIAKKLIYPNNSS